MHPAYLLRHVRGELLDIQSCCFVVGDDWASNGKCLVRSKLYVAVALLQLAPQHRVPSCLNIVHVVTVRHCCRKSARRGELHSW